MSVLGPDLGGARVLDLFAGSGALGLEALSRGAAHATFVERDRRVLRCLRDNIEALDAGAETTVVGSDVFVYLEGLGRDAFDIAVADPPYGHGMAARLVERYIQVPFARLLSVEHEAGERPGLPAGARERRYGDTAITFVNAADLEEET
jgi:16S rRNA (guanine966-N2)-methyltransferase